MTFNIRNFNPPKSSVQDENKPENIIMKNMLEKLQNNQLDSKAQEKENVIRVLMKKKAKNNQQKAHNYE